MSSEGLYGLEFLRNSISLHSNICVDSTSHNPFSSLFKNDYEDESLDDRSWSLTSLRTKFKTHSLDDLFKRYERRLKNAYLNVYLLLQISISVAYIIAIIVTNQDTLEKTIPEICVHSLLATTSIILFILICDESLFRTFPSSHLIISVFITFLILSCDLFLSIYFYFDSKSTRTASAFQLLIIIYFFLPLHKKYQAIGLGVIVTITHLTLSGVLLYSNKSSFPERIIGDAVYYICGNFVGVYSQILSEITVRRAFLDRREFIRSTTKKDYETKQEEKLLQSILPKHVSVQVRQELVQLFQEIQDDRSSTSQRGSHSHQQRNKSYIRRKPFSQLFVERHINVSILFADIVNFTPLTVKLKPEELVETLNQLFGQFDERAKRNNCLRIKLLGDCYYCVSGLVSTSTQESLDPTQNFDQAKNHAKNCVLLGLEMISIIKGIRQLLGVDVEMRIGVHTGNIISGILGIYKWQFDIWSKDVTIANHMESSGKPGKIHITRQTRDYLHDEFICEKAFIRDQYLLDNKIETYLISPKVRENEAKLSFENEVVNENFENNGEGSRSSLTNGNILSKYTKKDFGNTLPTNLRTESRVKMNIKKKLSMYEKRPTDVSGEKINILMQMFSKVDEQMKEAIDNMPLRKIDQWCGNELYGEYFHPIFMNFKSWRMEFQYLTQQTDPLFKFYIICALLILISMAIIQGIIMPRDHVVLWLAFGIGGSYLVLLVPFVWVAYIWYRIKDPHREMEKIPEPKIWLIKFFINTSKKLTQSWSLRTLIYTSVAIVLSTFAIIDVIECDNVSQGGKVHNSECEHPWYFTYSCTLAILGIYGFFRIHFLIKLLLCFLSLFTYSWTMFSFRSNVFDGIDVDDGSGPSLPSVYAHLIYMIKIILLLHIMDRQMEYINRLDFIWKLRLTEEHKSASITHATNEILIHNILPMAIAKIYMDPTSMGQGYSRSYTDVAVMFASIPNFMDFYSETDLNEHGIKCLQLLNEIIVDFDNALFEFEDVEKIKVIGSSYMAACGLEVNETGRTSASQSRYPSEEFGLTNFRLSNSEDDDEFNNAKRIKNLVTLVKFASAMMIRLQGIDSGPIVAGVIGADKPLYDIWGDTVNMASRMDSFGECGKIHLGEKCASLLREAGVKCIFRDRIKVKGKEKLIPTYFVKLTESFEIQYGAKKCYR